MYANDNTAKLVPNGGTATQTTLDGGTGVWKTDYIGEGKFVQWALGNMQSSDVANWTNYIQTGLLYPYAKDVRIYKCPADLSVLALGGGITFPHMRSYSMNCYLSPI